MHEEIAYSNEGNKNLLTVNSADRFSNWMYDEIKPHLQGNILELGSGIGTYSEKVVRDFISSTIIVSDVDREYVRLLKEKFKANENVITSRIDVVNRKCFSNIGLKVNTVFALNVLEHIEDDVGALNNIYDFLETGGRLVILVPAHSFLFNCIDRAVGHYRRYSIGLMRDKIKQTKFKIEKMFYFNFAAIFGWYINGNVLRKALINENAMGLYNIVVPMVKTIEKHVFFRRIGISLIVVLTK